MQVFTVAKMVKDSSLPAGSFGTVASSRTDKKEPVTLFLVRCSGALHYEK